MRSSQRTKIPAASRERAHSPATASLTPSTAGRLDNQIERAFHRTYGAYMGLRVLVQLGTREMLLAGASPEAIRLALTRCVLNHPTRHAGTRPSVMTDEKEMRALIDSMLAWADEISEQRSIDP